MNIYKDAALDPNGTPVEVKSKSKSRSGITEITVKQLVWSTQADILQRSSKEGRKSGKLVNKHDTNNILEVNSA